MDKNKIDYSLSSQDMKDQLENKCNLVTYKEIKNYKTIDELLGKHKKCVILYLSSSNYGHWTCIYEHNGKIFFFDSYGIIPNGQFKFIPKGINKALEQDHNYLLKLLYDSKKPIEYNEYTLQGKGTSTCGKWVTFRLKYPWLSIEDFKKLFIGKDKDPDYLINKLITF